MSQYNSSGHKGYVATAALREGVLVKISSGEVVVATAATDKIIGVTTNACEAGETVDVRLVSAQGTSKVRCGAAVAVGNFLTSDADGEAINTVTASDRVVGQALEVGADNGFVEMINCNFIL